MLDAGEVDEQTNCFGNCLINASCDDLETIICDPLDPNPSEQLLACIENCEVQGEGGEDFVCGDGEMIPDSWVCDGFDDCQDASDEVDCVELECADGSGTYMEGDRCDGFSDCPDASDELDCPGFVECADGNGSVPESFECDGEPDCLDGSDEQGCPSYACANGEMVVGGARCDFEPDCSDGSDEQGCAQIMCPAP